MLFAAEVGDHLMRWLRPSKLHKSLFPTVLVAVFRAVAQSTFFHVHFNVFVLGFVQERLDRFKVTNVELMAVVLPAP